MPGNIFSIPANKLKESRRKAFDITLELGKAKRYYKYQVRKAQKALLTLPDILQRSFEEATGAVTFVKGLKAVFGDVASYEANKNKKIKESTIKIREYLAEHSNYSYVGLNSVMIHSGRMLEEGIEAGATGKGKKFQLWVGFTARKKSPPKKILLGKGGNSCTINENLTYAQIAERIENGFVTQVTPCIQLLFEEALGVKLEKDSTINVINRPFIKKTSEEVMRFVEKEGLTDAEDKLSESGMELLPF